MNIPAFSVGLGILGTAGLLILLILAGVVTHRYWGSPSGSFRWHVRNQYLKQLSAVASLFCMTMAASYGLIQEPAWAFIYLIIAFKMATWWIGIIINHRT